MINSLSAVQQQYLQHPIYALKHAQRRWPFFQTKR